MKAPTLCDELVTASLRACQPTPLLRRAAARTLFDLTGCALAGSREPEAWPADSAGRIALAAHRDDRDDLHLGSVTHPGGVIWSAVAAAALETEATLAEAFAATALGYELTVRVAEALGSQHRRLWQPTATAGTVGAAGAVASLIGRGPEWVADAVAHAASVAGGSAHAVADRTGTRFLHRAHAASAATACGRAAVAGLTGGRAIVGLDTGALAPADPEVFAVALLRPRGRSAIEETGFRLYAANGFAHAAIDAALALGPLVPDAVETIEVTVSPSPAVRLASNPAPATAEEAWWSIEHAVAVALATGDADALESRMTSKKDVRMLCERIRLVPADRGWGAFITVAIRGETRAHAVPGPLGHGERPASDAALAAKWSRLAGRDDGGQVLEELLASDLAMPFGNTEAGAILAGVSAQ